MTRHSKARTGGELVVEALRAHGIDTVFCVPGESFLAILDALYDVRDEIRVVTCRHEHGAAVMAEAHGKLTGRPGVCLVTRGPGACNASIGVHTAFQDSTPMLLLIGQVERGFLGREAFQEVDFVKMFGPLAKRALQVEKTSALPQSMARSFQMALSHRPGPVVLSLPEDILAGTTVPSVVDPLKPERPTADPDLMEQLHRTIGRAQRPLMMVGGGGWTTRAKEDIVAFASASDLPTCCGFRRLDIFDNDDPNFVGELGISPSPALVARAKAADLLIAVGTRLGEIITQGYALFGPEGGGQTLIHVHPDADELGRVFKPTLAIPSGMPEFAAAARALMPHDGTYWAQWAADARQNYLDDTAIPRVENTLDLGQVMLDLQRRLPADAVITVDAGNFSGWPQRYLKFGGGRLLLGATNGAMGYGVPAAVAAKISAPNRMVVACAGDGGFSMTGQELATAVQYGAAPIILIFNNGMFGTIRMHQERTHVDRTIATGLTNPDFAALARSYGAHGEAVKRTEDFSPALDRAIGSNRAAVIELRMDPEIISTRSTLSEIRQKAKQCE